MTLSKASGQSALLSYIQIPGEATFCCTATDDAGNLFLVYSTLKQSGLSEWDVSVTKLDSSFHSTAISATAPFAPQTAAADSNDNLWIAGYSTLMRLASSNSPPLTVNLGGNANGTTWVTAIAIDSSGNIYATGTTNQIDFPVTPGAFQGFPKSPPSSLAGYVFGFVSKFSSTGTSLLSTLVRGLQTTCSSASGCGYPVATVPTTIAVDASGNVTVAGTTNTTDYPVTPNAPQTLCKCSDFASSVFITRLNPDFGALVWSTFLGGGPEPTYVYENGLAVEPDGGAVVVGATFDTDFPTTPRAIEPALPASAPTFVSEGFVTRLNSSGTAWVFSTYLSGAEGGFVSGVQTDSAGDIWVTASASPPGFPVPAGTPQLGTDLVLELAPDGSHSQAAEYLPFGTAGAGIVRNADDTFTVLGLYPNSTSGSLLRLPDGPVEGISILGVADSAATRTAGTVAPGEFLTLYGTGLGPASGLGAAFDSTGRISSELGGVTVLFDGQKAPLLWVSASQINLLVPYEIANSNQTTLQVTTSAGSSQTLALTVVPAQPNIFVVVNADGTVNAPDHPAVTGSVLTMYAGGAGVLNQSLPDGSLAGNSAPAPTATVLVGLPEDCPSGRELPVLYAGGSPGLVANVLQVNFQWQPPTSTGGFFTMPCNGMPYIGLGVGYESSPLYQIFY